MFHVKQLLNWVISRPIHETLFYVFLLLLPFQTRILYNPESTYINWSFNYHLAIFVYLSDLLLILCFTCWLLFNRPRSISSNSALWPILAIFALLLVALFNVKQNLSFVSYETLKWIELLLLVFYVEQTFKTRIQYIICLGILFIGAVLQSAIAISQFHVQHGLGLTWLGEYVSPLGTSGLATLDFAGEKIIRAYGTMPHPNVLAGFLIFGLTLGLFLITELQNKKMKLLVSCGTILVSVGVFVTFSRMAWLTSAIIFVSYVLYNLFRVKQKNTLWLTLAIGIVSCATIFVLWSPYLFNRTNNIDETSISSRGMFNAMSVELVKQNIFTGVGQGNYIQALEQKFHVEPWQYQPGHNIFVVIAVQFGLLGLILFVKLFYETFIKALRLNKQSLMWMLCFTMIMFIIMGQVDHYFVTIQQGRLLFFLVLGFITALPNLTHETYETTD